MESNNEVKRYVTQNEGCPILSVKVSPWKYNYSFPKPVGDIAEFNAGELERMFNDAGEQKPKMSFSLVGRYCSDIISGYFGGKSSFEDVSDKLCTVTHFCRRHHKLQSSIPEKWLCGLYLSSGKQEQVTELFEKNINTVPFYGDYAVCAFINAFFAGADDVLRLVMFSALEHLSDFDCKRSPAYPADREKYEKALSVVMKKILEVALREKGRLFLVPKTRTVTLQAFQGLPCPSYCERQLEITYIPYSENGELCEFISACIRHTDNLMRQGHGIKSKLVGFVLSSEYRKLISDTIREVLPGFLPLPMKVGRKPKEKPERAVNTRPQEESRAPEPIDLNIDFVKAKKLEVESWKLASMLGADYGAADISFSIGDEKETEPEALSDTVVAENVSDADIPEDWQEFFISLTEDEKKFLCIIASGEDPSVFAKKRGGMLIGYADSVNEKASDTYGDIILSFNGAVVDFIEDYEQELKDIFKDMYDTEVL